MIYYVYMEICKLALQSWHGQWLTVVFFLLMDSADLALKAARAALSGGITVVSLIFWCKVLFCLFVGKEKRRLVGYILLNETEWTF